MSERSHERRAIGIGGSIAGLFVGAFLRRIGWRVDIYKRITFDRSGKVIAEKPQLQIVTSWDRLRQVLLKAIDRQRSHFGHMFERVEQDGNGVQVYFANGRNA